MHRLNCTPPRTWDPYVMEFASKPVFWYLAVFSVAYWFITMAASVRLHSRARTESPTSGDTSFQDAWRAARNSQMDMSYTRWTHPYLTTRLRKAAAIAVYLAVFGVQLLQAYWVAVTVTRMTIKMFRFWLALKSHQSWIRATISFLACLGSIPIFGPLIACAVGLVLLLQVVCIIEIIFHCAGLAHDIAESDDGHDAEGGHLVDGGHLADREPGSSETKEKGAISS